MRIAMLHPDLPGSTRGGVAFQVSRLADALARRDHEVRVFSFSPAPEGSGYRVHRIRAPRAVSGTKIGRLIGTPLAFAARSYEAFDVVHAHGDSHLLVGRTTPVVRTFHGCAREEARHAERVRRKVAQSILVVGDTIARRTATVTVGNSLSTRKLFGPLDAVIPCGVDRELFHPGPKSPHPSVLFVGTLSGRKRGRLVVDVFRRAIRPRIPNCELWLVADEPAAGEGIRYWGTVSDEVLASLYRQAWVFTLPSTYEGFGVPYVEAMASGTAVVATPNVGAEELLVPESGGMLVQDRELGDAIACLLEDGLRRRALEERGRRYSAPFGWNHVADQYEQVYALAGARVAARGGSADATRPCTGG